MEDGFEEVCKGHTEDDRKDNGKERSRHLADARDEPAIRADRRTRNKRKHKQEIDRPRP